MRSVACRKGNAHKNQSKKTQFWPFVALNISNNFENPIIKADNDNKQ